MPIWPGVSLIRGLVLLPRTTATRVKADALRRLAHPVPLLSFQKRRYAIRAPSTRIEKGSGSYTRLEAYNALLNAEHANERTRTAALASWSASEAWFYAHDKDWDFQSLSQFCLSELGPASPHAEPSHTDDAAERKITPTQLYRMSRVFIRISETDLYAPSEKIQQILYDVYEPEATLYRVLDLGKHYFPEKDPELDKRMKALLAQRNRQAFAVMANIAYDSDQPEMALKLYRNAVQPAGWLYRWFGSLLSRFRWLETWFGAGQEEPLDDRHSPAKLWLQIYMVLRRTEPLAQEAQLESLKMAAEYAPDDAVLCRELAKMYKRNGDERNESKWLKHEVRAAAATEQADKRLMAKMEKFRVRNRIATNHEYG